MIIPHIGLKFYEANFKMAGTGEPVLCEVVEIRNDEIVRYQPVGSDAFVGEVHVNFFHKVVLALPT